MGVKTQIEPYTAYTWIFQVCKICAFSQKNNTKRQKFYRSRRSRYGFEDYSILGIWNIYGGLMDESSLNLIQLPSKMHGWKIQFPGWPIFRCDSFREGKSSSGVFFGGGGRLKLFSGPIRLRGFTTSYYKEGGGLSAVSEESRSTKSRYAKTRPVASQATSNMCDWWKRFPCQIFCNQL